MIVFGEFPELQTKGFGTIYPCKERLVPHPVVCKKIE
jgi:hypothetical protein